MKLPRPSLAITLLLLPGLFVISYGQGSLTLPHILNNVRKAVGVDHIRKQDRGFAVQETNVSGKTSDVAFKYFGRNGEVRRERGPLDTNALVFDGKELWNLNPITTSARYGSPYPNNQKQLEKLVLQWWVQSGWWLDGRAPLDIEPLPGESNEARIALSIRFKNGVVGSKLFVDRATWLPQTHIVEQAKGPYTIEFQDYREVLGFLYPHRLKINYDNVDSEWTVRSVTTLSAANDRFRELPPTGDSTFDNSVPAELRMAQGAPFPDGSKGHPTYVRPLVDGKDVGWFHFDTGADTMMIENRIADELKMPVIAESETVGADGIPRKVTIRKGKSFQLGRVTIKDPIYVAGDLTKMNAPPGEKRAGFCGYPLMARVVAEVTGGGSGISLYDPASYRLERGNWQELSIVGFTPAVTARVDGNRSGLFMLDTGASGTVEINSKFSTDNRLLDGRKTVENTQSGSGGNYKEASGSLDWFELAGLKFDQPKVAFRIAGVGYEAAGVDGVVGRQFMQRFTVVFDYSKRRIAFIRK
ncbi:MAG TPA: retropepsin-like aspartic protease [Pyrinomonadaceae bacterium]|nr:retropepsin-like aspartic protease [Pyrinomonadaceae bacterium]